MLLSSQKYGLLQHCCCCCCCCLCWFYCKWCRCR